MVVAKELLSTLWTQYEKVISGNNETQPYGIVYNQYAPIDRIISSDNNITRSVTGCVATATSQIIYYHLLNSLNNSGYKLNMDVLTDQDAYVSFAEIPAATVYISADGSEEGGTLSFAEINKILTDFVPAPTNPEAADYTENSLKAANYIAALNFSVGVILQSAYSNVWGTGTVYSDELFLRCGFNSADAVYFSTMDDEAERSLWGTYVKESNCFRLTDEAIEILIENIEKGLPVAFAIPGHAIVLDGYDREKDMFHLNYGWGPENNVEEAKKSTRWYTREEFLNEGVIGFVIDIDPESQETFTVTDDRVFGSGTLYRVIQQATAMQGANTIEFDLEQSQALELPFALKLKDETTLSGFNMTIFAGGNDAAGEEVETVNENEESGDAENEEQENAGNTVVAFSGEQGSRTEFANFQGNIIVNSAQKGNYAAFDFTEAVQLTVSTSNANIYAGVSQLEHSAILDQMNEGNVDELLEQIQQKVAIAGSDGDDQVTFDDETLVIGNIELEAGHDSLTVSGNSTVYGDIDLGNGDNTVTIFAGSSIHGNLLAETELVITLTGAASDVLFEITGDAAETFENITSITIDSNNAEADKYILFNQGNLDTLLQKLQIEGVGGILQAEDGSIWWNLNDGYATEAEENDDTPNQTFDKGDTVTNGNVGAEQQWLFENGSVATGSLSIHKEGEVKVMTGAKFIFDISAISAGNRKGIINNFDGINGTFHFSIKAALEQAEGSYLLAQNVTEWGFSPPITVTAGEKKLGTFEDEDKAAFTYGDLRYELVYDENKKTLSLVVDSAFQTAANDNGSVGLSWHEPAAATGYWVNISRSDEKGIIEIFSGNNALTIFASTEGEYEWQSTAPGLETEYREGGNFAVGENNTGSSLFDAGASDEIADVFIAKSTKIWGDAFIARHAGLPENWNGGSELRTEVELSGKNRYNDIFKGAEDDYALLYLSDSENGDALFLDDVYSAYPDSERAGRLSHITSIYAGGGDDIIDLTSDKFEYTADQMKIYGGDGDDVIWAGKDTSCYLYGDRGDDCLIGSGSNDYFIGGAGDDVIHGGGGKDLFAYGAPSTWGNDIIYQLSGEGNGVRLFFEQEEKYLKDIIQQETFDGGVRLSVDGYENSSITIYFTGKIAIEYAGNCDEYDQIYAGGGCGEFASQTIFEDTGKVMLA